MGSLFHGENTGKFADFGLEIAKAASAFGRKFNRLLIEFPSRLNRENLRAIREPEAGNSEPYPNDGTRCLAPHGLQVQILGWQPALFAPRSSDTLDGGGRFKLHRRVALVSNLERSRKPLYG